MQGACQKRPVFHDQFVIGSQRIEHQNHGAAASIVIERARHFDHFQKTIQRGLDFTVRVILNAKVVVCIPVVRVVCNRFAQFRVAVLALCPKQCQFNFCLQCFVAGGVLVLVLLKRLLRLFNLALQELSLCLTQQVVGRTIRFG